MLRQKLGAKNRVADALSMRVGLLATLLAQVLGFDTFSNLLVEDPDFGSVMNEVQVGQRHDFLICEGFTFNFKGNLLCIPL